MAVFGTDTSKPTVVRAGKATVTCNGIILLATNVSVSYQRPVEIVPTVGNKRVLSVGEGTGQFTAETIVAKDQNALGALRLNDDGCDPFTMTITFNDSACNMNGKSVTCHNCVSSSISVTAQGGRGYIGQGVTVTFTALTLV